MKNNILLFILTLFCYSSCTEENVEPKIDFAGSENSVTIPQTESNVAISFYTAKEWSASCNQSWCTLSANNGLAGNVTINVIAQENNAYDDRNASITIISENIIKDFTIIQKQKDAISISKDKYTFDNKSNKLDFEVNANVDFQVSIDASWIKQVASRSLTSKSLHFNIEENKDNKERVAHINLSYGYKSTTIIVTQGK